MTTYAVIGTSPFVDTTAAAGPFRSAAMAEQARGDLTWKGWNAEIVTLLPVTEIDAVTNDEGEDTR